MPDRVISGTGVQYQPVNKDVLNARMLAADKPGEHLWIMAGAWLISDPASVYNGDVIKFLDSENLITFDGPGCFKCEKAYSGQMAKRRCQGSIDA